MFVVFNHLDRGFILGFNSHSEAATIAHKAFHFRKRLGFRVEGSLHKAKEHKGAPSITTRVTATRGILGLALDVIFLFAPEQPPQKRCLANHAVIGNRIVQPQLRRGHVLDPRKVFFVALDGFVDAFV